MIFGYARVSTETQNLERQIDILVSSGVDRRNIFTEKSSGKNLNRPALKQLIENLEFGDAIYVSDLSRISRSRSDLFDLIEVFTKRGAKLISINDKWFNIDVENPISKLIFDFIASLNEFERNILSQRTKEGQEAARKRGRMPGRPSGHSKTTIEKLKQTKILVKSGEFSITEACKRSGISRVTYYNYFKNA